MMKFKMWMCCLAGLFAGALSLSAAEDIERLPEGLQALQEPACAPAQESFISNFHIALPVEIPHEDKATDKMLFGVLFGYPTGTTDAAGATLTFSSIAPETDFYGVYASCVLASGKNLYAVQAVPLMAVAEKNYGLQVTTLAFDWINYGAQFSTFANVATVNYGWSCASVNLLYDNRGLQTALFNGSMYANGGVQLGVLNVALDNSEPIETPLFRPEELDCDDMRNFLQIGLFNVSVHDDSFLQIGLLNFTPNAWLPCMPFVNWN